MLCLPQEFKLVTGANPKTTNGGFTGAYVSVKDAQMAWLLVEMTQAVGHATQITPVQATAVAGTGATALTVTVPIWSNLDVAASDTLVERTAAVNYAVSSATKNMLVVFQIDPRTMGSGYDVLGFTVADSSQATNLAAATWVLQARYPQATPPSATAD